MTTNNKHAALASEMHPCGHWLTLRSAVGQQSLSTVNRSCVVVFPIAFRKCTALMFSLTGVAVVVQLFDFTLAPAARLIDCHACACTAVWRSRLCVRGRVSCDLYVPLGSWSLDEIKCTVRILELKSTLIHTLRCDVKVSRPTNWIMSFFHLFIFHLSH